MDLITSAIIISIIYLIAFVIIDIVFDSFTGKPLSKSDVHTQCYAQFTTVFVVTCILGLTELDALLCSASH